MKRDFLEVDQPTGVPRYALNAIDMGGSIANESGNQKIIDLPGDWVGSIHLDKDNVVLFCKDETTSYICLQSGDQLEILLEDSHPDTEPFNFKPGHWIKGVWTLTANDNRVIYFVDGFNDDRRIDLDDLKQYSPLDNPTANGPWNVSEFRLSQRLASTGRVTGLEVLNGGGLLRLGSYRFAVEILDENGNVISTSDLSNEIAVDDEDEQGVRRDGGYNAPEFVADQGAVPPASKSIQLEIEDLDTNYAYYRVLVYRRDQGQYRISEVLEGPERRRITGPTDTYLYTGDSVTQERLPLERVTVRPVHYRASAEILEVNKHLVRMNTRERTFDWSGWQAAVINNVYMRPDFLSGGNVADFNNKQMHGFMPDEVYAFAVQYEFKDGTISPPFHIPGRFARNEDNEVLTIGTDIPVAETRHIRDTGTVERWEVYNTGDMLAPFNRRTAYWESRTELYPTEQDNLGNVFGGLAGTPVRHHRFPLSRGVLNATFVGVLDAANAAPAGPAALHRIRILMARPRPEDITVIDMSYMARAYRTGLTSASNIGISVDASGFEAHDFGTSARSDTTFSVLSPQAFFDRENFPRPDYVTFVADRARSTSAVDTVSEWRFDDADGNQKTVPITRISAEMGGLYSTTGVNRTVNEMAFVGTRANLGQFGDFPVGLLNIGNSEALFLNLADEYLPPNGDEFPYHYALIKRNGAPYRDLFSLAFYVIADSAPTNQVGTREGDAFRGSYTRARIVKDTMTTIAARPYNFYGLQWLHNLSSISRVDVRRRHSNLQQFYISSKSVVAVLEDGPNYLEESWTDRSSGDFAIKQDPSDESSLYNRDFSRYADGVPAALLPFRFDYDAAGRGRFPNLVVWSLPRIGIEQISDPWMVYLANNRVNIGATTDPITAASYRQQTLLIRTQRALWYTQPIDRRMKVDGESVFVGTGSFLGAPAYQFAQAAYGFGGQQHRLAGQDTEHGSFWVDSRTGRVFLWTDKLQELTDSEKYGMTFFFRDYLPGAKDVHCVYDAREERMILIRYLDTEGPDAGPGHEFSISFSMRYNKWTSFHSWFPRTKNSWNSMPGGVWSTAGAVYSVLQRQVWKHEYRNDTRCHFYGHQHNFELEFIEANLATFDLVQVTWYAQTLSPSSGIIEQTTQTPQPTFSKMIVYSRDQSSMPMDLIPRPMNGYATNWDNVQKQLIHAERNYRVAEITDQLYQDGQDAYSDYGAVIRLGLFIQGFPLGQGYSDRFFFDAVRSVRPQQWEIKPLRNKFHHIRLYYSAAQPVTFDGLSAQKVPTDL